MPDEEQLLHHWLQGNKSAIALVRTYFQVSQIWDDLYDGDKPVSREQINYLNLSISVCVL